MTRASSRGTNVLVALLVFMAACTSATPRNSDEATPAAKVITRISGGPDGLETAAAARTDSAAGLQQLWAAFQLEGTAPAL